MVWLKLESVDSQLQFLYFELVFQQKRLGKKLKMCGAILLHHTGCFNSGKNINNNIVFVGKGKLFLFCLNKKKLLYPQNIIVCIIWGIMYKILLQSIPYNIINDINAGQQCLFLLLLLYCHQHLLLYVSWLIGETLIYTVIHEKIDKNVISTPQMDKSQVPCSPWTAQQKNAWLMTLW